MRGVTGPSTAAGDDHVRTEEDEVFMKFFPPEFDNTPFTITAQKLREKNLLTMGIRDSHVAALLPFCDLA